MWMSAQLLQGPGWGSCLSVPICQAGTLLSPKALGCVAQMRQGGNSHGQLMDRRGMMKPDDPPAAWPTGRGRLAKRRGS